MAAFDKEDFIRSTFGIRSPKWDERPYPTCVLCGNELDCPWGHNPAPLSIDGKCCNSCNYARVLPVRANQMMQAPVNKVHARLQKKLQSKQKATQQKETIAQVDTSEEDAARIARYQARERTEAAARKEAEREKQRRVALEREARAAQSEMPYTPRGPSHVSPKAKTKAKATVEPARRALRQHAASAHEEALRLKEEQRIAEQEHRAEMRRLGNAIARGEYCCA